MMPAISDKISFIPKFKADICHFRQEVFVK